MSESLTEFLLARIAEDEAVAQFVASQQVGDGPDYSDAEYHWHDEYDLLYVWPARVLAECEAKRRIVERHVISVEWSWVNPLDGPGYREPSVSCDVCGWAGEGESSGCETLRLLALSHADHPDYREEWKP